jgi:BioD-like phosphotransacetylase family protein
MNTVTPRVFIAATRQNDGKTTTSLGLIAALQEYYPRIGYIKPVGQRFVEIEEQKIDEDTVLMDSVFRLNCPLLDMSPIAVEPDFTRKYLESANNEVLVRKIKKAFDRVAWEKDFVLCEGSGHAGVGSVFDLSNATVAKILGAKVIIVTQGGIGRPIDEVSLNQALFEKEGVEIIGVIVNKVLGAKLDYVTEFARRGFKRKGLELLGVIPHRPMLSNPTIDLIREELDGEMLNETGGLQNLVEDVTVGAMGAHNALERARFLQTRGAAHHAGRPGGHHPRGLHEPGWRQRRHDGGNRADGRFAAGRQRDEGHPRHAHSRDARGAGQLSSGVPRA